MTNSHSLRLLALHFAPLILFAALVAFFGIQSERFLTIANLINIVTQSSHIAIIAIGMTFVLLVGGIDLSVGANMYLAVAFLGLYLKSFPAVLSFPITIGFGLAFGVFNGLIITQLRVAAFITTLATLFVGRGLAIYCTGTKGVFFNQEILSIGRAAWFGIPSGIWALAAVFAVSFVVLRQTSFGREVYAVGADAEGAAKAGINVRRILFAVYCISGVCAAIGGIVSASQTAAAYSTFGLQKEFPVIAAAVLGGTSLFGGRGGVVGTVLGSVLIQTVGSGLVMLNANPYVYPLIISVIIFVAVFLDSQRTALLARLERRKVRIEA
jgi:ribose transport system permease protein